MQLLSGFEDALPVHNVLGFGPADYLELAIAILLTAMAFLWQRPFQRVFTRLATHTGWSTALLFALPLLLRLALLPNHPVPTPDLYDEFGHLFMADTLRHFRFANPPNALPQFFETFFNLQRPTYSSIYPIGQGLLLALNWNLFGLPWAGVLLASSVMCALSYWMLRGWTTPPYALLGGLLDVIEFGPLNLWTNSYWGGHLTAIAGCLVFGALPRLRASARPRDAVLLGAGMTIHLLTRPYESLFLLAAVVLFFLPDLRSAAKPSINLLKLTATVTAFALGAIGITLLQNRSVTGSWTMLPYQLSQYQYGVPAALTFQPQPTPHRTLTPQQALDYHMQSSFRAPGPETLATYFERLEYRVRYYRFFFLPPLYIALAIFVFTRRTYRDCWVLVTLTLFALGTNFFPAFQVHYIAACTPLFLLASVEGIRKLSAFRLRGYPTGREAAQLLVFFCFAHFLLWYSMHLLESQPFSLPFRAYETWDEINHGNPERRIVVRHQLDAIPGKLLVFVRYSPQHIFQDEWVYNAADIDAARIVWARDLDPTKDEQLRRSYPDRKVLLLEPDVRPLPLLTPYEREPQAPQKPPAQPQTESPFETVK